MKDRSIDITIISLLECYLNSAKNIDACCMFFKDMCSVFLRFSALKHGPGRTKLKS
jgi:hypothetical protein